MNKTVVKITESDFYSAQRLHLMSAAGRLTVIAFIAALVGFLLHEHFGVSLAAAVGGVVGFCSWLFSYHFIFLPIRCRRIYRQQKALHSETEISWNEETIEFKHEMGNTKMKWSNYAKYREDKNLFLLYQSDVIFNMIPKSSFSSEEQMREFRSHFSAIGN